MMKVKIRSLYAAPPGKILLAADLSQAESWVVAYLSKGELMQHYLNHSDIHSESGLVLFDKTFDSTKHESSDSLDHKWKSKGKNKYCAICGIEIVETERYVGKQNNHANSYGMKAPRQAEIINKQSDKPPYVTVSVDQCRVFQEKWHNLFPNIHEWHLDIQFQLKTRHSLTTPYGFTRRFYGILDDNLYRTAYSFIPQSTVCYHFAGAIQRENPVRGGLKAIREDIVDKYSNDFAIVNMSHDSFVMEMPDDKQVISDIAHQCHGLLYRPMVINGEEFKIPVDVEVGYNYGEMKGYEL